jgi:hypothetical protein
MQRAVAGVVGGVSSAAKIWLGLGVETHNVMWELSSLCIASCTDLMH